MRTEKVSYKYGNAKENAIDSVDFAVTHGRRTVILGENGCGKSTLIYQLNGVYKPLSGTVFYGDRPILYEKEFLSELRSDVSVVLQNPDDQIFSSTVEEDVAFGPLSLGLSREETGERISKSLERVGMSEFAEVPVQRLSYGQKKRVSLAAALASNPKILILDEPTAGLDPQMSREVMEITNSLSREGVSVVISTHDVNLIYPWAEDLYVMRNGRVVFSGCPDKFFSDRRSVNLSGLEQPSIFGINYNICTLKGKALSSYPKTMSQMVSGLFPSGSSAGTIFIYRTEGEAIDQDAIEEAIGKKGIPTAVYGSSARRSVMESNLRVDFYFNGIECCIREATVNHDSLIIVDRGLTEFVTEAVEALRMYGTEIKIRELAL
ncbi:MAG: energy-coupling factor ABC transporter ATP-binding protein [Candidatus Methanomethylophilaceae archaeon]